MTPLPFKTDPTLDLILERELDVPVELVWKVWTTPDHLQHWFCPKPWTVSNVKMDLRPGGIFSSVMHGPAGEEFPNAGCYLEIVPNKKLVFTDTLLEDFRPAPNPFFTAFLLLDGDAKRTKYTAVARHGSEDTKQKHEAMGFHDGWGTVVGQMAEYIKNGLKPV